jgi:hypothetical protein
LYKENNRVNKLRANIIATPPPMPYVCRGGLLGNGKEEEEGRKKEKKRKKKGEKKKKKRRKPKRNETSHILPGKSKSAAFGPLFPFSLDQGRPKVPPEVNQNDEKKSKQ